VKEINDVNIFPSDLFFVGEKYSKRDIDFISNKTIYKSSGVVSCLNTLLLFVTLDKSGRPDTQKYKDFFKNNIYIDYNFIHISCYKRFRLI